MSSTRTAGKYQVPSTCLRRSGFAQAGQIANKLQVPILNNRNGFVWKFEFWYHFSLLKNEFQKPKKLKESP
jgi:hypothetical protein